MKYGKSVSKWRLNRLVILSMTVAVLIALLGALSLAPFATHHAQADHNSLYVVCPDPIQEGNSAQMKIKRSGYRVVYATIFTHQGDYTAGPDDFVEYHGVKFESASDEDTLRVPIETKEDAFPEHDETFVIGFMNGSVWHQCIVTIEDDDAPRIDLVEINSTPVDRYAYRAGESIDIGVTMDAKVEVDESSLLSLYIGNGDSSIWQGAQYHSGSGTRFLVFRYKVQPEDLDSDGISVATATVAEDRTPASGFSGNIYAEGTDVPIDYSHPGVTGDWRQKVDGRPYVQSARIVSSPSDGWAAYRANQTIEVSMTFNTDVVVEGEVSIALHLGLVNYNWEEAARRADYVRGSGTDTLVFGYTVRPGDMDSKGVGLTMGTENTGFSGSGSIKARGTDVEQNPWYLGWGHDADHKVDTDPPAVSSLSFISSPANGEAYAVGETISLEVAFDEKVTLQGTPSLEIDVGTEVRQATVRPTPEWTFSDSLVFEYTVQEGDSDGDGVGIAANRLRLNDGGIFDSAGITVGLSHAALGTDSGQKVDTSAGE